MIGRRAFVAAAVGVVTMIAAAAPAFAHVELEPPTFPHGGEGTVAFRVPNEEDSASTVKLEVQFPTDHPIGEVLVDPPAGWTATVQTTKLATPIQTGGGEVTEVVSDVVWSGGKIDPGQYALFPVLLGGLPDGVDQLVFKAVQTYSNGDVVRWIDEPVSSGPEPEHPAPTLTLTASESSGSSGSSDSTARLLGIVGIVVGALGLGVGVVAVVRGRRRAAPPVA